MRSETLQGVTGIELEGPHLALYFFAMWLAKVHKYVNQYVDRAFCQLKMVVEDNSGYY